MSGILEKVFKAVGYYATRCVSMPTSQRVMVATEIQNIQASRGIN